MTATELYYALALSYIKGIGPVTAKSMIQYFGDIVTVFSVKPKELLAVPDFGLVSQKNFITQLNNALQRAETELKYIENAQLEIAYFFETTYPKNLKELDSAPLLLFYKGLIDFTAPRFLSIVGTRNITPYGKTMIEEIIADLTKYQPTIVSGLAYGCDYQAHLTALKYNLPTIGVLAHGLDQLYPSHHRNTAQEMLNNGGLLTEYSSNTQPIRENFLQRNRIIAGLSSATLVIESAIKGGAMVTAHFAFDNNREVLTLPGRANDLYSQGCNKLINKNIASLVTNASDIVSLLNWDNSVPTNEKAIQRQLFVDLNDTEHHIYDYLKINGVSSIDQIASQLPLTMPTLSSSLLTLELKGVVRALSGKQFEII